MRSRFPILAARRAFVARGALAALCLAALVAPISARAQVLFQQFTYPIPEKLPGDVSWWTFSSGQFAELSRIGVWGIWHPVPTKGGSGGLSMGYDPYDLYDLGEKNQRGSTPTRFGSRDQYLEMVARAQSAGLRVVADVVLNHTGGADQAQVSPIQEKLGWDDIADDSKIPPVHLPPRYNPASQNLRAWSGFYPKGADTSFGTGRFFRDARFFHPTALHPDHNEPYHHPDFGSDYCFEAEGGYVADQLLAWCDWFRAQSGVDGFRLDAVKLAEPTFLASFAARAQAKPAPTGEPFFLVGEFWDTNEKLLAAFQTTTGRRMKLFDFGLFYAMKDMVSKSESFDMRTLLTRRLADSDRSVTFVSNHDVDRFDPVPREKRRLPYALILTLAGQPSVFHSDYFDPVDRGLPAEIARLIGVHNRFAFGPESVLFSDTKTLAIARGGHFLGVYHNGSDARGLRLQTPWRNRKLTDLLGGASVVTDARGFATIDVAAGGYRFLSPTPNLPDRFAAARKARAQTPTAQTFSFADDLSTGRLSQMSKRIDFVGAVGSRVRVDVSGAGGDGAILLELRDSSGKSLAASSGLRARGARLELDRLPGDGTYTLSISAPGEPTRADVTIRYQAPTR